MTDVEVLCDTLALTRLEDLNKALTEAEGDPKQGRVVLMKEVSTIDVLPTAFMVNILKCTHNSSNLTFLFITKSIDGLRLLRSARRSSGSERRWLGRAPRAAAAVVAAAATRVAARPGRRTTCNSSSRR